MSEEKIKDGGHAFPPGIAVDHAGDTYHGPYGMSLRDWFAGQALVGSMLMLGMDNEALDLSPKAVADHCFSLADAMLKAREAQP